MATSSCSSCSAFQHRDEITQTPRIPRSSAYTAASETLSRIGKSPAGASFGGTGTKRRPNSPPRTALGSGSARSIQNFASSPRATITGGRARVMPAVMQGGDDLDPTVAHGALCRSGDYKAVCLLDAELIVPRLPENRGGEHPAYSAGPFTGGGAPPSLSRDLSRLFRNSVPTFFR